MTRRFFYPPVLYGLHPSTICLFLWTWVCNVYCLEQDVQKVYMASSTVLWKVLGLVPPDPFALLKGGFCIDCNLHQWYGFYLSNSGFVWSLTEFKGGVCNSVNNNLGLMLNSCQTWDCNKRFFCVFYFESPQRKLVSHLMLGILFRAQK